MKNIKLPNKPSDLLRLSVSDCKKVEKMKTRKLNMNTWHVPDIRGCQVCMAGAVMDRTLKLDPKLEQSPYDCGDNYYRLLAINNLRVGDIYSAFSCLNYQHRYFKNSYNLADIGSLIKNNFNLKIRRAPWDTYLEAADKLEALGF